MKTINIYRGTSTLLRLCHSPAPADDRQVVPTGRDALPRVLTQILFILFILSTSLHAQIQQAWVARYNNNGITNGTHQASKMVLDSSGNVYITGFSQNANPNLGYVTIKYAPNCNQLWASRFDSTNYPSASPTALALDSSNNVLVTGNALTVKYDSNGNQLWTAPYAGTALAVDGNANCAVTGISTSFGTVELNPSGGNLWMATYPSSLGPGVGQQVLAATDNCIYVAGYSTVYHVKWSSYVGLLVIRYATNGSRLWTAIYTGGTPPFPGVQVAGAALDTANNLYLVANSDEGPGSSFFTFKYSYNGVLDWTAYPDGGTGPANGLTVDNTTNVLLVGQDAYQYNGSYSYYYTAFKLNSIGSIMWTKHYPQPPVGSSAATAIAVDQANNVYVTGYSPGANSSNNIVTIKYDQNGNQIWLQRYTAPGNGNAVGNAIAVDKNGNVYVTGYETLPGGGTEIVTIKYSPINIQRRADGTVLLQAQGSAGESFDVQASTNLQTWQDLGQSAADSNGLFQFDDTNAAQYNARFYLTRPQ